MAITHIVHFAYNCNEDTKKQIASRFLALKDQCVSKTSGKPYILSLIGGKNNSPEGMNDGLEVSKHASAIAVAVAVCCPCPGVESDDAPRSPFAHEHMVLLILTYFRAACCECQHTFVVTFANLEDRDYYLDTDPAHLDFKQFVIASGVSKGVVMDFDENQF